MGKETKYYLKLYKRDQGHGIVENDPESYGIGYFMMTDTNGHTNGHFIVSKPARGHEVSDPAEGLLAKINSMPKAEKIYVWTSEEPHIGSDLRFPALRAAEFNPIVRKIEESMPGVDLTVVGPGR